MDSIAYELVKEEPREVWKCLGRCGRFRHRRALPGLAPAICCGQQAGLFDRYSQPIEIEIEEMIRGRESPENPRDESTEN